MHRSVSATTILLALATVSSPACSPDPDPGFEDGTYAAAHRAQIELDCDRRFVCAQRTNEQLTGAAFENCLTTQAMKLNASPDEQFLFQLNLNRCPNTDPCHYVQCADSGFMSYGQQQLPKVQYTCQQKVQCQIDNSNLAGNPTTVYESCVLQSVLVLDGFDNATRISFQETFFPCMPMASCAFVSCFGF